MSNLEHLVMQDEGSYAAAFHTAHNHGLHADPPQTALMDHYVRCPYEDKIISDGTAARMALMFLRDFLEQLSGGQAQQSYRCPMVKCRRNFPAPLQLIQHVLSCQDLVNGEFACDKCNSLHSFPTNEKEWAQWAGRRHQTPLNGKVSFSSKVKATLRKKDPRKQNPPVDSRPSTAASETPSTTIEHHIVFPGSGRPPSLGDMDKPILPPSIPEFSGGMFWPAFNAGHVCDLSSTISSINTSSTFVDDSPSKSLTENNSQTTLFNPGISTYQPPITSAPEPANALTPQQYMFGSQSPYGGGLGSLSNRPPSPSAMSVDQPVAVPALSQTELRPAPSGVEHGWWGPKVEVETPRPAPSSPIHEAGFNIQPPMTELLARGLGSGMSSPTSPCRNASPFFGVRPPSRHAVPRAVSHDSMQLATPTVYGTPVADGSQAEALSPHSHHNHHPLDVHQSTGLESTEELRCDECNWRPRGVRENLKGYLRKHKNTHKGLRLACDVPDCTKTFSRLDNLKKHKKDKHGIEEASGAVPARRTANNYAERMEEETEQRRPNTVESEIRGMPEDYSMLWPALHF
ncbi:Transcription factor Sp3 [Madurella mycetomatis]|uniref:Transcription factor Sp3 n=1 Tax=Madurella mycetomatis TaxID=100816 RepID=A0A175W060_9PEZI|nr:Transcription factor Sp3 [Madurella mycetomatis]